MKSIKVTCSIVAYENKVLVVQRSEKMSLPLKWEFSGGKIEEGESEEECVKREVKEELNIEIELISRLTTTQFDYPNVSVQLIPFLAKYSKGDIKLCEHKQYLWLTKDKLRDLDWAEADIPVLNEYLSL
jgi:8-oxo-dGTP diphosphatase